MVSLQRARCLQRVKEEEEEEEEERRRAGEEEVED